MRVSVREGDPGYRPHVVGAGIRVLLDGIERTAVITADEEGREVLRYVTPLQINAAGDDAVTELLTGDVAIILPPGFKLDA